MAKLVFHRIKDSCSYRALTKDGHLYIRNKCHLDIYLGFNAEYGTHRLFVGWHEISRHREIKTNKLAQFIEDKYAPLLEQLDNIEEVYLKSKEGK
jgi:hypothetical protein